MGLTDAGSKSARGPGEEVVLIKLDIINEVVNRTGITKTKAEMPAANLCRTGCRCNFSTWNRGRLKFRWRPARLRVSPHY